MDATITVDKDKFGAILTLASFGVTVLSQSDGEIILAVAHEVTELVEKRFSKPKDCTDYLLELTRLAELNTATYDLGLVEKALNTNEDQVS